MDARVWMQKRAIGKRTRDQAGQNGGFGQRQILCMLTEEQARSGLDTVRAVTEVGLIRVQLEDLVLGEALLDVDRKEHLGDLAPKTLLRREENLLRQLLGERRGAFHFLAGDEV